MKGLFQCKLIFSQVRHLSTRQFILHVPYPPWPQVAIIVATHRGNPEKSCVWPYICEESDIGGHDISRYVAIPEQLLIFVCIGIHELFNPFYYPVFPPLYPFICNVMRKVPPGPGFLATRQPGALSEGDCASYIDFDSAFFAIACFDGSTWLEPCSPDTGDHTHRWSTARRGFFKDTVCTKPVPWGIAYYSGLPWW